MIFLDTSIIFAILRGTPEGAAVKDGLADESRVLASISAFELLYGVNLSKLCDELDLHHAMIEISSQPTKAGAKEKAVLHEKGTLIEAIFGVVYLEFGFGEVLRLVPYLQ